MHRLESGYPLWLGGIQVDHSKGAVGHSDADVLLHAICDALLGACALGDIGTHFPDTDPAFKGIDSKKLLAATYQKIRDVGYLVGNVDCMLCLEKPKIKPYIPQMQTEIARILEISEQDVSIKATTNESMGYVGREEGVNAMATALLYQQS